MARKSIKDKYLNIPGFPRYRLNLKEGALESMRTRGNGDWATLKPSEVNNQYSLYDDPKGTPLKSTYNRLLYAAMKHINPRDIPSTFYITKIKGKLIPLDACDFAHIRAKQRAEKTIKRELAIYTLQKSIYFSQALIKAFSTRDFSEICALIYGMGPGISAYLRKHKYSFNQDMIDAVVETTIDITLKKITEMNFPMISPSTYMKKIARGVLSNIRKQKARERSYDDDNSGVSKTI